MSDFFTDLNGVLSNQTLESVTAKNSTNKKAGSELDMTDFLQLMVATFQNQSIDDVASTSDMMNQMMQMSVINAITNLSTMVTETTGLSYAASLVGKEVTIGQRFGNELTTITGTVTGTGTLNGQQVVFIDDKSYWLSDVMAVGRIPDEVELPKTGVEKLASALDISDTEAARLMSAWNKYWSRDEISENEQALLSRYGLLGASEADDLLMSGVTLTQQQMQTLTIANELGLVTSRSYPNNPVQEAEQDGENELADALEETGEAKESGLPSGETEAQQEPGTEIPTETLQDAAENIYENSF